VHAVAVLEMDGNNVKSARIVLGQVAPIPWRSLGSDQALTGKTVTTESAMEAAKAAVERAKPLSHNRYKIALTKVAVKRAILQAASQNAGGAA